MNNLCCAEVFLFFLTLIESIVNILGSFSHLSELFVEYPWLCVDREAFPLFSPMSEYTQCPCILLEK